jgi:hypothetical protein
LLARRDLVGPVEQLGIQPTALDQPIEVIPTESVALVALDVQHIELADQVAKMMAPSRGISKPPVAFKRTLQHRAAVLAEFMAVIHRGVREALGTIESACHAVRALEGCRIEFP